MTQPAAFTINIPDTKLAAIRARVEAYSWFPAPANEQGFAYGMSTPVMQDIQRYWLETYDWRAAEAELNRRPRWTGRPFTSFMWWAKRKASGRC
jgi:microsomal epoxide hydrolase